MSPTAVEKIAQYSSYIYIPTKASDSKKVAQKVANKVPKPNFGAPAKSRSIGGFRLIWPPWKQKC